MIKYILWINIFIALIIDVEVKPFKKSCLSKMFGKEAIRFEVNKVNGNIKKNSLVMSVETREDNQVESLYHEVGIDHAISFNNVHDTHLFFCIDNLEDETFRLKKTIKHGYAIGDDKNLASKEHSNDLLDISFETLHRLNTIKNLHKIMVDKINKKKDLHFETESIITVTGMIMLCVIVIIGIIQIYFAKKSFNSKKMY